MKIRFLHGPRKGEVDHAPFSQETKLLLGAGLIEEIPAIETSSEPPTVRWSITTGSIGGRVFVVGKCSRPNCSTFRFEGDPKFLPQNKFIHGCAGITPESVPDSIVAAYTKAKSGEQPTPTADMAEYANAMWKNPHVAKVRVNGKDMEISLRPEGI